MAISKSLSEPGLKDFLIKAGVPNVIASYMIDCTRLLSQKNLSSLMCSTFISYGGPDESFAGKLQNALHQNGVRAFLFTKDAPAGEKLHRVMHKGIQEHDRIILICSENSLNRPGVLNEIEEALAREAREGGKSLLIPITLDSYVFDQWRPKREDIAQAVRDRVIVDFKDSLNNPDKFSSAINRLLESLKK